MARLPYLEPSDLSPENRDLLARNVNLYRALAHSPDGTRSFLQHVRYFRFHSRLDPRLRELAILQVGYAARSPYEFSHHIRIGRDFSVSDEDIRAIADETEGRPTRLEPLAKAVLRAARELTLGPTVSDETFAALKGGLDNGQLADLMLAISFYTGVVRLLSALQIDVEEDYQRYLKEFPLPPAG
ncbi:MAG TPA: carboxymuconolactone decarboxylase family protein [Burkholderiales bacterium]|nr:carboxymuconolactone decarboxylase family protein [Burkholderiales bacterium]